MIAPGFDETIVALATPPGRGAIAVIRVSGPAARSVLERLMGEGVPFPVDRSQALRRLRHPTTGELLDHAMVTFFGGPRTYTGEDVLEISTHGGLLSPRLVMEAVEAAGARPALAGEFTRRAYLNGKMDLLQAEAVADLIDGTSPAIHRAALHQAERGLSRRIEELRTAVVQIEALVAYSIDFPEEDEPPVPPQRIRDATTDALRRIERLLETVPQGMMLRSGALVVLAGRPNAGKSSLFNALLGLERSIVTEIPGTTRDAVEADALLRGFPFRLVDTAGLRDTTDRVEAIGVEVARRYLAAADVLLLCLDATVPPDPGDVDDLRESTKGTLLAVETKADLARTSSVPNAMDAVRVSAVTGEGLDVLGHRIVDATFGEVASVADPVIVTRERHRQALADSASELEAFLEAMGEDLPMAIAAVHLRQAVGRLEDLIGVVSNDDVLGAVFSRFCVGK